MVSLPLNHFAPQAGLPEAAAELNRLKKLIVVQRKDVMQLAERWVSKHNVVRQNLNFNRCIYINKLVESS